MKRPSAFHRMSILMSRQDLNARRNGIDDGDVTVSAFSLQEEDAKSKNLKSSLSGKRPSTVDSRTSRSVSVREMRRHQPMLEHSKKDILDYLDGLIESVEWSAYNLLTYRRLITSYTLL